MTTHCSLVNISGLPQEAWSVLTVPTVLARGRSLGKEALFLGDDGREFRAVKCSATRKKTVFRVFSYLDGGQKLNGVLVPADDRPSLDFQHHQWVFDDLKDMIPSIGIVSDDGTTSWMSFEHAREVESSPAHKKIELGLIGGGMRATFWYILASHSPIVEIFGRIVWSDRKDPRNQRTISHLIWRCPEYVAFDFAKRNGIGDMIREGADWTCLLNREALVFVDGMGLPLSGRMLCADTSDFPQDPATWSTSQGRDFNSLMAATQGPIVGLCHEWDGEWLATGRTPKLGSASVLAQADWDAFVSSMETYAGYFATRPWSLGQMPGQTGSQPDFGVTKGISAVTGMDARIPFVWRYSVHADILRGYTHFEADGQPVRSRNHPSWVTWSSTTHYNQGVSQDRLGKSLSFPFPSQTGRFQGVDDEHMSRNFMAAYMMLSDDPLMESSVSFILETDASAYRFRYPNNGSGAARAQGRTIGAWAQLATAADETASSGFLSLIARRAEISKTINTLHVNGPMKVLAVGSPDGRKQVYNPDGSLGRWVSMWEHGLAMVGLYQALKVLPTNNDVRFLAETVARTLASCAFFKTPSGLWWTVWDILWVDGELPSQFGSLPTNQFVGSLGQGDVGSWTLAGCIAAREILPMGDPLWSRVNEYVLSVTSGLNASSREAAEWWAS